MYHNWILHIINSEQNGGEAIWYRYLEHPLNFFFLNIRKVRCCAAIVFDPVCVIICAFALGHCCLSLLIRSQLILAVALGKIGKISQSLLNPFDHCYSAFTLVYLNMRRENNGCLSLKSVPHWIYAPPATYLRIPVQIHIQAHWKNLTFLSYEYGKGQYTFYPIDLSRLS